MKIHCAVLFFVVSIVIGELYAQSVQFNVIGLDGSARVQRSNDRSWKQLEPGSKLSDNDLVETYFQTKLILQFGRNNVIILGSNSKALLNIVANEKGGKVVTEISATLFSGGLFSKAISDCRINIYTANAVGVLDSGSVTTVAEGKTGETGFQVLGGVVYVRNIAQQKGIELRSGLTTMIQPGKEPTAPLYITHRHVAVLKHFFGDEYIATELDASGIVPTDERGRGRSTGFSEFSTRSRGYVDEGMVRSLFSLSRIYGSIMAERELYSRMYRPIVPPATVVEGRGCLDFANDVGFSAQGVSERLTPSVLYTFGKFDAGIRLTFVQTADSAFSGGFATPAGLLDKIRHVAYGTDEDRLSVFLGQIDNMTLGYGLIVDRFSNVAYTNSFHSLGAVVRVRISDELLLKAFTADCAAPLVNGAYVSYEPSMYHFGLGYVGDVNQYAPMIGADDRRLVALPNSESLFPDVGSDISSVHTLLFDFSADIVDRYDLMLKVSAEFARKLTPSHDGFVARMPGFRCDLRNTSFGGGVIMETGRLLSGQFGPLYFDRRYTVKSDLHNDFIDSVLTPNNRLAKQRETLGFSLFYRVNPFRGVDADISWKQDFYNRLIMNHFLTDSTVQVNIPFDYSFRFRVAINDSLFKYVKIVQFLLQQSHGALFPERSLPFSSWTFNGNLTAVTIPFFFNLSFETGVDFFYFDSGKQRNDRIDAQDFIFIATAGVRWGFK